jgi:transposase-like protein
VGQTRRDDRAGDPHSHVRLYVPALRQARRWTEYALLGVAQETCVHGVSTRKVDALMKALGLDGIAKSEVSRIGGELDTVVAAFRTRPLTGAHRYLWVDATYHTVRVNGRVLRQRHHSRAARERAFFPLHRRRFAHRSTCGHER